MSKDLKGSRLRAVPERLITLFCEVVIPTQSNELPFVLQKFPHSFADVKYLQMVADLACPVSADHVNSICQGMVTHFSFVMTALDSKWTFGYARHTPGAPTCLVLLSELPWHETFYRILNHLADLFAKKDPAVIADFLQHLYTVHVPSPGFLLVVNYNSGRNAFTAECFDHTKLPSIPEDRNLTELFNACDDKIMIGLFKAMLHERKIIIVSRRLTRLSACVQAANLLIYPMHWQHLFIPVLPIATVETLGAPFPYIIGVPSSTWERLRPGDYDDAVVLDVDKGTMAYPQNRSRKDGTVKDELPPEMENQLKRNLRNPATQLGDGVALAFLRALVFLLGDFRSGLRHTPEGRVDFDPERFIAAQPSSLKALLEKLTSEVQMFREFVELRIKRINDNKPINDIFDFEVTSLNSNPPNKLTNTYKDLTGAVRTAYKQVKDTGKVVKDKGKKAYSNIQGRINTDKGRKFEDHHHPAPLQRMYTSPNLRLPPERPPPPVVKRPTAAPPAVPVVNDLVVIDESPRRQTSGGSGMCFQDSFVPDVNSFGGDGDRRASSSAKLGNSLFHQSKSDNTLDSKYNSVPHDFEHHPNVRRMVANFDELSVSRGDTLFETSMQVAEPQVESGIPLLNPPPRKENLRRTSIAIARPKGAALQLLSQGFEQDSRPSQWSPQATTNPFANL